MKKLLVVVAVLLVAAPLVANEIELIYTPAGVVFSESGTFNQGFVFSPLKMPSEEELYNDNGTASYHWVGGIAGFASKFVAPYDLYVVAVRLTCYNSTGRNYYIDILGEDEYTPGKPDRDNSLIGGYETFWQDGVSGDTWIRFDLTTIPFLNSGDVFFAMSDDSIEGLDNAPQDNQAPGPPDSAWWYFGGSSWTDYDFFGAMLIRVFVNDDADGPYGDDYNPADGDTAPPDTNIVWHCCDDDIGVDSDTINTDSMLVEVAKSKVSGTITIEGDPSDYTVTFDPDSDFSEGDTVNVTLSPPDYAILDLLTNAMDEVTYSFSVGAYVTVQPTSLGYIKAMYE